jgi:hypothetical protein
MNRRPEAVKLLDGHIPEEEEEDNKHLLDHPLHHHHHRCHQGIVVDMDHAHDEANGGVGGNSRPHASPPSPSKSHEHHASGMHGMWNRVDEKYLMPVFGKEKGSRRGSSPSYF